MSEKIEVGDLVMVVRYPCCGLHLGKMFIVEFFDNYCFQCDCGHEIDGGNAVILNVIAAPIAWLKKIHPLVEPVFTEHRETVKVRA